MIFYKYDFLELQQATKQATNQANKKKEPTNKIIK